MTDTNHNNGHPASGPYPGSPLARGPMGGDQFTQIHNGVFRDPRLTAKAMGIFAHLSTHQEGWRVDERTIARAMHDGRDAVRSGLRELEKHHYLIRVRERAENGRLGVAVWFYTDLPAQIRALGITDDTLVAAKVREAFEVWRAELTQNRRSAPMAENPSLGVASGNVETPTAPAGPLVEPVDNSVDSAGFPRSEPKAGLPTLAEPTVADPPHKNTNTQNTRVQDTNSGGPTPPNPPATDSLRSSVPKTDTQLPEVRTTRLKSCSNPPPAREREIRARELAGPLAVAAVEAEPDISETELAELMARVDPSLTQQQAVTRAAALLAWTRKPGSDRPASPPEPQETVRGVR